MEFEKSSLCRIMEIENFIEVDNLVFQKITEVGNLGFEKIIDIGNLSWAGST